MSLTVIGWLFTFGVLAHNVEEAFLLPTWSQRAGRWHAPVHRSEVVFGVTVLSVVLVVIMAAASMSSAESVAAYLLTGYVFTMVLNVFAPHVVATIAMRRYMPGTATAVLLNLPLGCWFLSRAIGNSYVRPRVLAWVGPLVAISLLASIPLLFAVGRRLWPRTA